MLDYKCIKMLIGNLKGRDNLERLGAGGRLILKWTLKECVSPGLNWLMIESIEHDSESWGSIQDGKLSDCQLSRKNSAAWN
jgi:hypothetical protein